MRVDRYTEFRQGHLQVGEVDIVHNPRAHKTTLTIPVNQIRIEKKGTPTIPDSLKYMKGKAIVYVTISDTNNYYREIDNIIHKMVDMVLRYAKQTPSHTVYRGKTLNQEWEITLARLPGQPAAQDNKLEQTVQCSQPESTTREPATDQPIYTEALQPEQPRLKKDQELVPSSYHGARGFSLEKVLPKTIKPTQDGGSRDFSKKVAKSLADLQGWRNPQPHQ